MGRKTTAIRIDTFGIKYAIGGSDYEGLSRGNHSVYSDHLDRSTHLDREVLTMKEEIKRILEEMRANKPALFALMSEALKKEAAKEEKRNRPRPSTKVEGEHGPVQVYATMVKHVHCVHCGHRWERTYRLLKGETISWCSGGRAKQAVITRVVHDPIHIHADVMNCHMCGRFIEGLSREDLEYRYLKMLNETSLERMSWAAKGGDRKGT